MSAMIKVYGKCGLVELHFRNELAMDRRIDLRTALIIDAAINACENHGLAPAANELADRGIPTDVVVRVLTRQGERRVYPETGNAFNASA